LTALDWLIVVFVVLMATIGWRQGFVAGALALAGFVVGALIGSRIAPLLLAGGAKSPYAPVFALAGGALGGAVLAGVFEGAGFLVRRHLRMPVIATLDGVLGAVLSAAIGLAMAWVAGTVALQTPGASHLRRDIQRSAILRSLNGALPPAGLLNALARFDPFPRVDGPEADVPAPRAAIARDPEVEVAAASVVKIQGTACGLGVEGTGWVARGNLVVTNAHVVAGQDDTIVQVRGEGEDLEATPVAFDPDNDVAVLRVAGLDAPALAVAGDPRAGTSAAILGFPGNGPYDVRAGRLGQTRSVFTQDAYGRGPKRRSITSFRGLVRPGNSGGPMVDGQGRVVTTVFASARGAGPRGGYGVPNAVVRDALQRAAAEGSQVDTGPCA
jgi:S1-C subfamily serine protease